MKGFFKATVLAAAIGLTFAAGADAATFKWASQGDILTFDPHAQNESFNNAANGYVYEALVRFVGNTATVEPALAESWTTEKDGFAFKIRKGVKFHEGQTLTPQDVVFSIKRALNPKSQFKTYTAGIVDAILRDDGTVFIKTTTVSPVILNQLTSLRILCESWAKEHNVLEPQNFIEKEESYAARHENGTGPYKLKSREVDIKTVFVDNPDWWDQKNRVGNITEAVYTPIKSAATRTAALLSKQVDFVLDPAPQDIQRLRSNSDVKLVEGPETRVVMISVDQLRDASPYVRVNGAPAEKNPFKDIRVRKALYQAIDINTLKRTVMRGASVPTGTVVAPAVNGWTEELNKRLPYDVNAAKALLAEAGYPNGFEFTLDTPNNRWINDESICKALAGMWAKIGIKVNVNAVPRASYFPKVLSYDSSACMVGWGVSTADALFAIQSLTETYDKVKGNGLSNIGRISDPKLDELIEKIKVEADTAKRNGYINEALTLIRDNVYQLPLHAQVITWAMQKNVDVEQRSDNKLPLERVKVK
jgi:peptide/nickel transport system substrate-binding protein